MTFYFFFFLISSIFVPADEGFQEITIVYVEANPTFNGSYHEKTIYLNPDNMWIFDYKYGLTVWDHEVLHAWGYTHADMRDLITSKEVN